MKTVEQMSAFRIDSPSRYDPPSGGNSGSSDSAEKDKRVDPRGAMSPKTWKASETKFWKSSSRTWTARRSTGSPLGELSPSTKFRGSSICRSMSYERIATSYLSGEWPRSFNSQQPNHRNSLHNHIILTADKWTQTTDDVENYECGSSKMQISTKLPLSSINGGRKNQNLVEKKLASNCEDSDLMSLRSSNGIFWSKKNPGGIVSTEAFQKNNFATNNSSADGFNQEVEKLIRYTGVLEPGQPKIVGMTTPDGHRAPIAELLSMGCPNGRMLLGGPGPVASDSENHFVRIPEDVPDSPFMPTLSFDTSDSFAVVFNHSSSTERNSGLCQHPKNAIVSPSPVICKSLRKRQAPEGSEGESKSIDSRSNICNYSSSPVKMKTLMRFNIPSEHSAFCPLLTRYVGKKSLLMLSISPRTKGEIQ